MKIKKKWITAYLLAFCLLLSCFLYSPLLVYADTQKEYSSVLTDLTKDSSFKIEDYPVKADDYSLNVVQVAESSGEELLVYVYQPSGGYGNLVASSINISTANLSFVNYKLNLCNHSSTLYKYVVENFVVSEDLTRSYEITSIYRPFNAVVDTNTNNGNTINEVNYPVAKKWVFTTTETGTSVYCQDIETIEITDKYVGFVRYEDGDWWHLWGESACDRHFVAFSTDRRIDRLIEADIYFQSQETWLYTDLTSFYDDWTFGDVKDEYAYLTYTQKGNYDNGHYNYVWDRIQTVDDFVASVNISSTYSCGRFDLENISKITNEELSSLQENQWVLSFKETAYEINRSIHAHNSEATRVSNVTILRLQFETDSVVYNLGVIDNKQTGSEEPINDFSTGFTSAFKTALALFLLIALLIMFPWLFKVIWWVISAPFKIIGWIIKKFKRKKSTVIIEDIDLHYHIPNKKKGKPKIEFKQREKKHKRKK